MKKLYLLLAMLLAFAWISFADSPYKMMTLYPGWNVVSTPAILSWIMFSNWWEWINFSKLSSWQWISVPATIENITPLNWFMVYNNNSGNVSMVLHYKNIAPTEAFLQRNLNYWWDFLWIVTTNSPFSNIWNVATMSVDFTNNGGTNNLNKVNKNYIWNSTSSSIDNPELWEAYWIFINQENAVYWAINNWGIEIWEEDTSWTITIPTASSSKNTVLLKAKNQTLATFVVKPSGYGLNLENLVLMFDNNGIMNPEDYRIRVAWVDYSDDYTPVYTDAGITTGGYYYLINKELPTEGLTVEITLKEALTGTVTLNVLEANSDVTNYDSYTAPIPVKIFTAKYASALVYLTSQTNEGSYTSYKLGVEKYDDDYEINNVQLWTWSNCTSWALLTDVLNGVEHGDTFEIDNTDSTQTINCISYTVSEGDLEGTETVKISIVDSSDYFKVKGASWRVYKED